MKTKIKYIGCLGSFLDEKNIKWESINDEYIYIYHNEPADLFLIGMQFAEFQQEINQD